MAALNKCIFLKISGRLSSAGPEILAFISHRLANFQQISDCFTPNFKLKYENSENTQAGRVNSVVFRNTSNQTSGVFLGHPVYFSLHVLNNNLKNKEPTRNSHCRACKKKIKQNRIVKK